MIRHILGCVALASAIVFGLAYVGRELDTIVALSVVAR